MNWLVQDLRHALRLTLRAPPYTAPDRIVILSEEHPGGNATIREPRLSNLTFEAWREGVLIADLAARRLQPLAIDRR